MMGEMKDIPKHWQIKRLGEVCKIFAGYGFPKNIQGSTLGEYPFYKVGDISRNVKAGNRYLKLCDNYIDENTLHKLKAKPFPKHTIVFAKIGEGLKLNRRAIINTPGIVDNNAVGLKAMENVCDDMFLFNFLTTVKLEDYSKATTVPSVRKSEIEEIPFPLPPLPEQQAIVAKIEELLSDLENGKQQLQTAQQQLKVYRQSLLKWAFEGKLTNKKVKDGELPKGWKVVELKSITDSIQYGYTESSSKEVIGPKFLRITDIQENKVDWNEVPYCNIDKETKKKYLLKDGDLVFARTGATVGKSFLIKGEIPEAVFASYLIRVRVNLEMNEKYLSCFFHSPNYWGQITEGQVGIGQPNVNGTKLGQLKITIAPLKEQQLIVDELESKLTVCDKIEETIIHSLQQSEALRQSILKKAFEGKLVEQNPNDETSSKLLERIKAEREKNETMKKKIPKG